MIFLCFFIVHCFKAAPPSPLYEQWFTEQTMRVDYFHAGTATEEHCALDRVVNDGSWPGSKHQLIDQLAFGLYLVQIHDHETDQLLFSQGFATVFGEWQTIEDAKHQWGVFHESLRFPWPKKSVKVVLNKRNVNNEFKPIWKIDIDPGSRLVNPAPLESGLKYRDLMIHGPPEKKVDLLILGDGYRASEMKKFNEQAMAMANALFEVEPFRSRKNDFNLRLVETPSQVSGVNRPHAGIFKRTALSAHFSSFDSERYVLSYDNRTIREVASTVPYEYMIILVNERTYGGGGIFRWMSTASAGNAFSDYLFVHEFGHHFAALADEYYTSSVAYQLEDQVSVEPWEPNITALLNGAPPKWADLVTPGTPLPTPWAKEAFEKHSRAIQKKRKALRAAKVPEAEVEQLFSEQQAFETKLLSSMPYAKSIGAFEGAGYRAKGYYRSAADCVMFTRDRVGFCPACSRAIHAVIDQYNR